MMSVKYLCLFNTFQVKEDLSEQGRKDIDWRTKKVKDFFLYLVHHRNEVIVIDDIIKEFWGDFTYEAAKSQIYSSIYQMRTTIDKHKIPIEIKNNSGAYFVEFSRNELMIDVDIFDAFFKQNEQVTEQNEKQFASYLALYTGEYLRNENYDWTYLSQIEYRTIWLKRQKELIKYYITKQRDLDAVLALLNLQKIAPKYEWSYIKLIEQLEIVGDNEAIKHQQRELDNLRLTSNILT